MLRSILRAVHPVRFNHVRVPQLADTELREQTISRLRTFTSGPGAPAKATPPVGSSQGAVSPQEYRSREEITLRMPVGVTEMDPIQRFADAPEAIRRCSEMCAKFPNPTSIQAQAWPIALAGHDLVSIARTGSGKTLGFLIPVFNHIAKLPRPTTRGYGPVAVILAPTRELAQQIEAEAKSYSNFPLLCAFGGVSKTPQIQRLKAGVDIIIATPGRLNDLLSLDFPATDLRRCSFLVLDEADRMLDMGFEPQLRDILSHMRDNKRQTLMFSATWPKEVRSLAMDFLSNPAQINIGGTELNVCPDVHQTFHLTNSGREKADLLLQTLKDVWEKNPRSTVMLFTNTKLGAEQVADFIKEKTNTRAHTLHGDKSQEQRDFALSEFRTGRAPIIVCTDVASRGIDVKNVGCVINYDFPTGGVQDWIHRVGRTGRQGTKGEAVTFLSAAFDGRNAVDLEVVLTKARQEVPDWMSSLSKRSGVGAGRQGSSNSRFGSRPGKYGSSSGGRYGSSSGGKFRSDFPDGSEPSYGYGSDVVRPRADFTRSSTPSPTPRSHSPFNLQPGSGLRRINPERMRRLDPEDRPMRRIDLGPADSRA
jgi:ATP-dependent RNA helicase DDX5/DBP2